MPSLGPLEILVIFIVALLVFGPNKLPELARQVGKGLAEFRKVQHHLKGELDDAIHSVMDDDKPKVAPPVAPVEVPPVEVPPVEVPPVEVPAPMLDAVVEPPVLDAAVEPPAVDAGSTRSDGPGDTGPTPPPLADDA